MIADSGRLRSNLQLEEPESYLSASIPYDPLHSNDIDQYDHRSQAYITPTSKFQTPTFSKDDKISPDSTDGKPRNKTRRTDKTNAPTGSLTSSTEKSLVKAESDVTLKKASDNILNASSIRKEISTSLKLSEKITPKNDSNDLMLYDDIIEEELTTEEQK